MTYGRRVRFERGRSRGVLRNAPRGRSWIRLGPERVIAGVLGQLGDALDLAQPGGQLERAAVRRRARHQPEDRAQRRGVENSDVFEVEDQVIEAARAKLADLRL